MDCDREIPVLSGWLNIVQNSSNNSSSKLSKKKSTTSKYCMLFDASQHGIERLEIYESEKDTKISKFEVLRDNCVKVTSEKVGEKTEITVLTKSSHLILSTDEEQAKKWEAALKKVAFKEENRKTTIRHSVIETDNDLYYSSHDEGVFEVLLLKTDIIEKLNENKRYKIELKKYILELTLTDIQLKDLITKDSVLNWPYRFIRKYGYHKEKFTFEAGRKCSTGEGILCFYYPNPVDIFRCIQSRMKTMKEMIKGDNSVHIECGESQLSAALSMEAGSRSPLPPSPNHQKTPEFETAITQSHLSMTRVAIGSSSIGSDDAPTKVPTLPRPRKSQLTLPLNVVNEDTVTVGNNNNSHRKSPVQPLPPLRKGLGNDYACIQNITDAWKTLGIDEPRHTERNKSPEKDLIEFSFNSRGNSRNNSKTKFSPVKEQQQPENNNDNNFSNKIQIIQDHHDEDDDDGNYERLNFLRSTSKHSNGYEKIINITNHKKSSVTSVTTPDDYEVVVSPSLESAPDITACRLADDSYLGYGKLRKFPPPPLPPQSSSSPASSPTTGLPPAPQPLPPSTLIDSSSSVNCFLDHHHHHNNYTGFNYAIVSKPKQV